jgi:phenol 2-monooxygenase
VDKPNPSELPPSRSFAGKVPFHHPFATRIAIGMRLPDTKFVCHCDGRPWFLCDRMSSDGRWRVITFIGDYKTYPVLERQMQSLGEYLKSPGCFVSKYTPGLQRGAHFDTVFENLLVHAASLQTSEWEDFPQAWRPRDSRRVMDYWKIYADAEALHDNTGDGYEKYGIDPSKGALVVVRPDGYVAVVTEPTLEGMKRVTKFFDDIMIPTIPNGF